MNKYIIIILMVISILIANCSYVTYSIIEKVPRQPNDTSEKKKTNISLDVEEIKDPNDNKTTLYYIDKKKGERLMYEVVYQNIRGSAPGGETAIMIVYLGKARAPIIKSSVNNEALINMLGGVARTLFGVLKNYSKNYGIKFD